MSITSRSRRARLVLKGLAAVIAVLPVSAIGLQGQDPPQDGPVLLHDLPQVPHEQPWSTPGTRWTDTTVEVADVDSRRSVVFTQDAGASSAASGHLALVDSAARTTIWNVRTPALAVNGDGYLPSRVVGGVLIQQSADDRLHAVDLRTGAFLSAAPRSARPVGCDGFERSRCADLDGDLLLQVGRTVERVSARALGRPKWSATFPGDRSVALTENKVVSGSRAVDVRTGKPAAWSGTRTSDYSNDGEQIYAYEFFENGVAHVVVDPRTGAPRAKVRMGDGAFVGLDADLLVYRRAGTVRAVDAASGRERWHRPIDERADTATIDLPTWTGLVAVPSATRRDSLDVVRRTTGSKVFSLTVGRNGFTRKSLVGLTATGIVLAGRRTVEFVSLRSGRTVWTHRSRAAIDVQQIGDRLVLRSSDAPSTLASLID